MAELSLPIALGAVMFGLGLFAHAVRHRAGRHSRVCWSTDRLLFDILAAVMPGVRAVLRRVVEVGGTVTDDDMREYFIDHPQTPIPQGKIGGVLTSVGAVRRIGPDNRTGVLAFDDRVRVYRIEPALLWGLKRAFDLADARPDLLRQDPAGR